MQSSVERVGISVSGTRSAKRLWPVLIGVIAVCLFAGTPAVGAAETEPSDVSFHAADLLDGGSELADGSVTLILEGAATEGDTIEIILDEDEREAFEITDASLNNAEIGIAVEHTAETVELELTDLGGNGEITDSEVTIDVNLRAFETVASEAAAYESTAIGTVVTEGFDVGLDGTDVFRVSIAEAAEIGFTADEIDENIDGSMHEVSNFDQFVLSFSDEVTVADGDTINLSINPDIIKDEDEDGIGIRNAAKWEVQNENISQIDVSDTDEANILESHSDQVTIKIYTSESETKLVSDEAISVNIQLLIDEESMKYAANRYHKTDFLNVDVEGEGNTELTDNEDIRTESPLFVDIYPSAVEQFELAGPEAGTEIAIGESELIEIETIHDRFGNRIRQPEFEVTLEGAENTDVHTGIEIDTDERDGLDLKRDGQIPPRLGVFDLRVELTDIEGPETPTTGSVTATVSELAIYPDEVQLNAIGPANDFDVNGGTQALAIDLGVSDAEIDAVDIELRKTAGNGTITVDRSGGSPTETELWEDTEYAGDDELRPENTWVIERGLTASDFDVDGVRTYVFEADTADRYEITADVMPYEGRLVANETDLRTSTVEEHGEATRDIAELVATGPIEAVADVAIRSEYAFVGTEIDDGEDVRIDLGAFLDANGNTITETNETVIVEFGYDAIESGNQTEIVKTEIGPTVDDPAAVVTTDPTALDSTALETGANASITIDFSDGSQRNETELTLVHRVVEPEESGWHTGSLPQPATLYVDADGPRDLTQWNPNTERYESFAEAASGDVFERSHVETTHLHRGFYFHTEAADARLGFDFVTDDETAANETEATDTVELEDGWHLASSNYDISAHAQQHLETDVNWTEYGFSEGDDAFLIRDDHDTRIHDFTNGSEIDGSETVVEYDDAYWIRVRDDDETPLVREIVSSTFTEAAEVQREEP